MSRFSIAHRRLALSIALGVISLATSLLAQETFESAPIDYTHAPTNDSIDQLQQRINSGEVTLPYDEQFGYLPAVLEQLGVLPSSQTLVFSQTSFQLRKISPKRPRALYFNDSTYVGWVQFGDVIELTTIDPQQGPIFYTLEQDPDAKKPTFVRDQGQCLTCHASSRTQDVPGLLVRSLFVNKAGVPLLSSRTFLTDHTSPLEERWGGWYVTGTHGDQRHMGNTFVVDKDHPEQLDREAGANVTDLSGMLNTSRYLTPHSDIVALMLLEHQTQTQNAITRANYEARMAQHQDQVMNRILARPDDFASESTQRRIASAGDNLLKHLLLVDEAKLTAPLQGTSAFASEFAEQGVRDPRGRSLRDLDLQTRLFKYPCSYLIDSPSFKALPQAVKNHVYRGLHTVLTKDSVDDEYSHLSVEDRRACFEILTGTNAEFAASANVQ